MPPKVTFPQVATPTLSRLLGAVRGPCCQRRDQLVEPVPVLSVPGRCRSGSEPQSVNGRKNDARLPAPYTHLLIAKETDAGEARSSGRCCADSPPRCTWIRCKSVLLTLMVR